MNLNILQCVQWLEERWLFDPDLLGFYAAIIIIFDFSKVNITTTDVTSRHAVPTTQEKVEEKPRNDPFINITFLFFQSSLGRIFSKEFDKIFAALIKKYWNILFQSLKHSKDYQRVNCCYGFLRHVVGRLLMQHELKCILNWCGCAYTHVVPLVLPSPLCVPVCDSLPKNWSKSLSSEVKEIVDQNKYEINS